jgi:predicted dehydrogenase
VYIATPNHRHKSECLAAFAAGKAVLCEKPLATTPGDAREIADAARAAGVFCMEAMWTQFIPAIGEVERLIGDGAIGDPRVLIASFGMPVAFDPASRFYDAAQGGGALLDRGCYPVSLALRLLGPVTGVKVERIEAATGVDATTSALLSFAQGRTALISVSLDTLLPNEMSIGGTEGRLVLHEPITRPSSLVIKRAALGAEGSRKGGRRWGGLLRGGWPGHVLRGIARARARHIPVAGNGMNYEIAEVQRCLAEGRRESAVMPLARSIETLDVLAAMAAGRRPDGD